ncbi:MAG: hypothetical protein JST26_04810 [Bacteroidetes bacterium]|nr:hypothetical protein [Bacteroidota bacterium]
MKARFAPTKAWKELKTALLPYNTLFDEWVQSPACFLTVPEIVEINIYLKTRCYAAITEKLPVSIVTAANDILKIISKLNLRKDDYLTWKQHYLNCLRGKLVYVSEADQLLNAPALLQYFSPELKTKFKIMQVETLYDLLKEYSENDLLEYWDLDQKQLLEIKKSLLKFNLSYLLSEHSFQRIDSG